MPERAQMKQMARSQIKGNIGILFAIVLVMGLISATLVGGLFYPAMNVGLCLIYIGIAYGQKPSLGDLFKRANTFGKALWLSIITGFFTMLWTYLLFIPGIIKALSYSMGPYIMAEHPDWTARQCLNESKRIMKGNIGKLFVLQLSFILWYMLCGITFGIAYIYVLPYVTTTVAHFYNAIKGTPQAVPQGTYYPPQAPQQYPPQAPQQYPPQAPQQYPPQAPQQYPPQAPQQYPPQAPQQYPPQAPQPPTQ